MGVGTRRWSRRPSPCPRPADAAGLAHGRGCWAGLELEIDGERRTAILLHIDDRTHRMPDPELLAGVAIVLEGHSQYRADDAAVDGDLAARPSR